MSNRSRELIFALTLFLFVFAGCSYPRPPSREDSRPPDPVLQERVEKDALFKSENSPILPRERTNFRGLSYYPIDPDLRFSVRLQRFPAPAGVRLGTNTGEISGGLRYGYFDFRIGDQACRLHVYRLEDVPDDGGAQLFVPFRDATSGKETYAAGRYIDLKENTSAVYALDFNRAYNPYCAYNTTFSCPVAPAENTLKIAIRAGEKKHH